MKRSKNMKRYLNGILFAGLSSIIAAMICLAFSMIFLGYKIITVDSHAEKLDKVLAKFNITNELAVGVDIQIDILGIARRGNLVKLFFIEAKKTNLTLRDLGQLWAYCKLINPEEAFLITSAGLGTLNKIFSQPAHAIFISVRT